MGMPVATAAGRNGGSLPALHRPRRAVTPWDRHVGHSRLFTCTARRIDPAAPAMPTGHTIIGVPDPTIKAARRGAPPELLKQGLSARPHAA